MISAEKITSRHYGLDWLRIAAFAILIIYHLSMAYSPGHWIVQSDYVAPWLVAPLEAISPWRLLLLFLVSGYASAMLLQKLGNLSTFLKSRSKRLLVPLFFAIAVIVPPQSWVREIIDHGYSKGFVHFWVTDYFRFAPLNGQTLPHWEHLWFVGYLWFYTMLLGLALALRVPLELPKWLINKWTLVALPVAGLAIGRLGIAATIGLERGMFDDWTGHLHYVPAFLFGFLLARQKELWVVLRNAMPLAMMVALIAYILAVGVELMSPDMKLWSRSQLIVFDIADSSVAWSVMLIMPVLADRFLNFDHPWRLPLSRAVFPAYIVHQTAIVLLIYWAHGKYLSGPAEAAIVLFGTVAVCIMAWLIAKSHPLAGKLLGYEGQPEKLEPQLPRAAIA